MKKVSDLNKIHLVGIGGIGVSAVAKLLHALDKQVSGSDGGEPTTLTRDLEKRGIKIFYNHHEDNLPIDADLLIYSSAVPQDNPERLLADREGIEQLSYAEFLGELSLEKTTIAVSGTHGKSTTTAMIGKIFERAGLDPTVIVGTKVPGFDGNLRLGKSNLLIVEACEWQANMLKLSPQVIVLNNLEEDHLDFYRDLDDIKRHFQKFIDSLPLKKGFLAYNGDDENIASLIKSKGYATASWGLDNDEVNFFGTNVKITSNQQSFTVDKQNYVLRVPGSYNVYNTLAAITVAKHFNIDDKIIAESLSEFTGTWRRFEIVGTAKNVAGTTIISDYAHHPTAVLNVIKATKEFYPNRRLVLLFQPHHYDRTAKLFADFVKCFDRSDVAVICEVYDVLGRQNDGIHTSSSKDLVEAAHKNQPAKEIIYAPSVLESEKIVSNLLQPNDVLLVVGAGDIDKVARNLVE
jgi:UDP-N-acetylmuramate--alanine ligase